MMNDAITVNGKPMFAIRVNEKAVLPQYVKGFEDISDNRRTPWIQYDNVIACGGKAIQCSTEPVYFDFKEASSIITELLNLAHWGGQRFGNIVVETVETEEEKLFLDEMYLDLI